MCVTVSWLGQEFALWSLLGALRFSIFYFPNRLFYRIWAAFPIGIMLALVFDLLGFRVMLTLFHKYLSKSSVYILELVHFWGAFEKLRQASVSFVMFVCPSVRAKDLSAPYVLGVQVFFQ